MKLTTILYNDYEKGLPQAGRHILAQTRGDNIIVYQAFNAKICQYAVENQQFGGPDYKFSRMSWIKPNFLWMMYRSGWAQKDANQNRILAIEISQENFRKILARAVDGHYNKEKATVSQENWKKALAESEVRLQWDPDHDPHGGKKERRAIQLGLRGETLKQFGTDWIVSIEDITPFVLEQKENLDAEKMEEFKVVEEAVWNVEDKEIESRINTSPYGHAPTT